MNTKINRSVAAWIWDLAGEYRARYVLSVLSAVCGVICGNVPYFVMANIIPEFTSNLLVAIAFSLYLFVLDCGMVLAVLVTEPIGFCCYARMRPPIIILDEARPRRLRRL